MLNERLTQRFAKVGLQVPDLLLPRRELDYRKWAVIACDQFTSKPEYWRGVETAVEASPSTLRLMLPEGYLGEPDLPGRISTIHQTMERYLADGTLEEIGQGFVLVERRTRAGAIRSGLLAAIDLERYDYRPGARTLVRATEGTIAERIPPRTSVRRGAAIEVSHVLVLFDDPGFTVLGELIAGRKELPRLYDFELMRGGGIAAGYHLADEARLARLADGFERLAKRTGGTLGSEGGDPFLFAVGDGNHSLAAAKAVWEETKELQGLRPGSEHPGRYALVELINIHDPGMQFEPIHRLLFGGARQFLAALTRLPGVAFRPAKSYEAMAREVSDQSSSQRVGVASVAGFGTIEFAAPSSTLAVGTLQELLDAFLADHERVSVDYVHGTQTPLELGRQADNAAFFLPPLSKSSFFPTIAREGCLPRKTFSMGEAEEKRYYLEARRILPD